MNNKSNYIPKNLKTLKIADQIDNIIPLINGLKNLKKLIGHNCCIDFKKCHSDSIEYFEWKALNRSDVVDARVFTNLKYFAIKSQCKFLYGKTVEVIEFKNVAARFYFYSSNPLENVNYKNWSLVRKLIINSSNISFFDSDNKQISLNKEKPEKYKLLTCSIKEMVFGKHFNGYITNIIPPSVTKCTFYGNYKGTLPNTIEEVIINLILDKSKLMPK